MDKRDLAFGDSFLSRRSTTTVSARRAVRRSAQGHVPNRADLHHADQSRREDVPRAATSRRSRVPRRPGRCGTRGLAPESDLPLADGLPPGTRQLTWEAPQRELPCVLDAVRRRPGPRRTGPAHRTRRPSRGPLPSGSTAGGSPTPTPTAALPRPCSTRRPCRTHRARLAGACDPRASAGPASPVGSAAPGAPG